MSKYTNCMHCYGVTDFGNNGHSDKCPTIPQCPYCGCRTDIHLGSICEYSKQPLHIVCKKCGAHILRGEAAHNIECPSYPKCGNCGGY